jgi:hypothetical protein
MSSKSELSIFLATTLLFTGLASYAKDSDWGKPKCKDIIVIRKKWLEEVVNLECPKMALQGTFKGAKFVPDDVSFYRKVLQITHKGPNGDQSFVVRLPEHNVEGKTFLLLPNRDGDSSISLCYNDKTEHKEPWSKENGASMKLEFGSAKDDHLSGLLLLRIGDESRTQIGGYFHAKLFEDGAFPDSQ